jgi:hypothetical protein
VPFTRISMGAGLTTFVVTRLLMLKPRP